MSWMLLWIPALHLLEDRPISVIADITLDLEGRVIVCDEEDRSLTASKNVVLRLIEVIVGNNHCGVVNQGNTRRVNCIRH